MASKKAKKQPSPAMSDGKKRKRGDHQLAADDPYAGGAGGPPAAKRSKKAVVNLDAEVARLKEELEAERKRPKATTDHPDVQCPVCLGAFADKRDFVVFDQCGHALCYSCALTLAARTLSVSVDAKYIEAAVEDRKDAPVDAVIHAEIKGAVKCPLCRKEPVQQPIAFGRGLQPAAKLAYALLPPGNGPHAQACAFRDNDCPFASADRFDVIQHQLTDCGFRTVPCPLGADGCKLWLRFADRDQALPLQSITFHVTHICTFQVICPRCHQRVAVRQLKAHGKEHRQFDVNTHVISAFLSQPAVAILHSQALRFAASFLAERIRAIQAPPPAVVPLGDEAMLLAEAVPLD